MKLKMDIFTIINLKHYHDTGLSKNFILPSNGKTLWIVDNQRTFKFSEIKHKFFFVYGTWSTISYLAEIKRFEVDFIMSTKHPIEMYSDSHGIDKKVLSIINKNFEVMDNTGDYINWHFESVPELKIRLWNEIVDMGRHLTTFQHPQNIKDYIWIFRQLFWKICYFYRYYFAELLLWFKNDVKRNPQNIFWNSKLLSLDDAVDIIYIRDMYGNPKMEQSKEYITNRIDTLLLQQQQQ